MNTEKIKGFIEDEINQTVVIFEEEYPELSQEFKEIQDEMYRMFAAKMLDYGLGNISLGSNLEEEEDKKLSLTGIWLRCNDKINRLKNLLRRDGKVFVGNESMLDSFMDISNYGIIARLVMENKWKK
jgi:hypothetical protein